MSPKCQIWLYLNSKIWSFKKLNSVFQFSFFFFLTDYLFKLVTKALMVLFWKWFSLCWKSSLKLEFMSTNIVVSGGETRLGRVVPGLRWGIHRAAHSQCQTRTSPCLGAEKKRVCENEDVKYIPFNENPFSMQLQLYFHCSSHLPSVVTKLYDKLL